MSTAEWMPIESAPSGVFVLVAYAVRSRRELRRVVVSEAIKEHDGWYAWNGEWSGDETVDRIEPSHWMPFPEPPQGVTA